MSGQGPVRADTRRVSGIHSQTLGVSPLPGREPVLRFAFGLGPWGPQAACQPPAFPAVALPSSAYKRDLPSPEPFAFVSVALREREEGGETEVVEKIHRETILSLLGLAF